jgi:hypothetical protein
VDRNPVAQPLSGGLRRIAVGADGCAVGTASHQLPPPDTHRGRFERVDPLGGGSVRQTIAGPAIRAP